MTSQYSFGTIEFRNGIYQGYSVQSKLHGAGIFMDDRLRLYCSVWTSNKLNSQTAIIIDHAKYIYGQFVNGKMSGFNIYRSGETVLLGNFQDGKLKGQFLMVFEAQLFVMVGYISQQKVTMVQKRGFKNDEQLRQLVNGKLQNEDIQCYFSFVRYLQQRFCFHSGPLRMQFDNGVYRFGFDNGLGVIFDEDNYISNMGCINKEWQMCGLGIQYGKMVEAGNFTNEVLIKYPLNQKPVEDVTRLFRSEHKKSIHFRNDFVLTKAGDLIEELDGVIRKAINSMDDKLLEIENNITRRQLNQSLVYQSKNGDSLKNERLVMMRQQLMRSVSRGIEIKPSKRESTYQSKYPDDMKRLEYSIDQIQKFSPIKSHRTILIEQNSIKDYLINQNEEGELIQRCKESQQPLRASPIKNISPSNNKRRQIYHISASSASHAIKNQIPIASKEVGGSQRNQPVFTSSPKQHLTNKRVQELIQQYKNSSTEPYIQSPYRRHLISQSIRKNQKRQVGKKGCKQKNQQKQPIQDQFKSTDRPARSYLEMFRGASPQKTPQKQKVNQSPKLRSIQTISPLRTISNTKRIQSNSNKSSIKPEQSYYPKSIYIQCQRVSPSAKVKTQKQQGKKSNHTITHI